MISGPFDYDDADGDRLWISPSPVSAEPAAMLRTSKNGVRVEPADLPEVVGSLYQAVGRPEPIVLDRPEILPTARIPVGSMRVEADGEHVKLHASENNWYRIVDPRGLAAALVTAQERNEAGKVAGIAAFLEEAMDTDPESLARELVRRFRVEERDEWVRHPGRGAA